MRDYIFRGKRKDTKTWVYGSLITTPDGPYILEQGESVEYVEPEYHSSGMGCGLEDRNITDRYEAMAHGFECAAEKAAVNYPQFIPVIPETVGQFTNRIDHQGGKIFEGDAIKHGESIRIIEWRWTNYCAVRTSKTETILLSFCENPIVIGNVFDNPGLVNQPTGGALNMIQDPNVKTEETQDDLKAAPAEQATEGTESAEEGTTEG